MGEKGSIKNLYKAWRLFLNEQKKKKKQKKEKKPSKAKVFVITFFTFLLSPFFFSKKNNEKKATESIKKVEMIIDVIEKTNNVKVLKELKKELILEKAIIKKVDTKIAKEVVNSIDEIEKLIDMKIVTSKDTKKEEAKNIETMKGEKNTSKDKAKGFDDPTIKIDSVLEKKSTKEIINDPDILEFLNYMKLEINSIDYKLGSDLNHFQLKYLKVRITELNSKRENFKDNYDLNKISEQYKSKDKYHLLDNNDKLEKLYNQCNFKLEELKTKEKEEEKKKKEKEKKVQEEFNLSELNNVNKFLKIEIKKQQLQISKLQLELAKTEKKLRKPSLLNNIKKMLNSALKVCLSLIPIFPFKNKLLGGLTNAYLLNNSIRGIRNAVNDEKIEYALLLNSINNQKDCIFNTRLVYEDAITQIEFLKYDLIQKFSFTDLKDIFNKIYEIEEEIKYKNNLLNELEETIETTYDKTREKVKKYM